MKEPINVIYVTHYTELYGANKSLLDLLSELKKDLRVNPLVLVPGEGPVTAEMLKRNINYRIVPFYNEVKYGSKTKGGSQFALAFTKGLIKLIMNMARALRLRKDLHSFRIVHTNASATFFGAYLSLLLGKKHVWHIREFGVGGYEMTYDFGYGYFNYWANKATAVISISQGIYEARAMPLTVPIKPVIYNGVVSEMIGKRKLEQYGSDGSLSAGMRFAVVGVIGKAKAQLEAVQAFAKVHEQYPKVRLKLVGAGSDTAYMAALTKFIERHELINVVEMPGYLSSMDEIYHDVDCVLMCCRNEAFGRVTAEAFGRGIPVIGYNNGGTKELVREGVNGYLYLNGDEELAERMFRMLDWHTYEQLSQGALSTATEFMIHTYADKVYDIYTQI